MIGLYDEVRHCMRENNITMSDIAWKIGKSRSQTCKLLREGTLKYEDLKIVIDYVGMTNEQILTILKKEDMTMKNKWIPADVAVPKKNGNYMTCSADGYIASNVRYCDGYWNGSPENHESAFDDVVAWAPMPKPYKKGGRA